MNWLSAYKSKVVTAREAVSCVRSGWRIFVSGNVAVPYQLVSALAERKDELRNVEIIHLLTLGVNPLTAAGMEKSFRENSFFIGPSVREAVNDGRADYIPIFLSEVPYLFESGQMPLDVALIHVSPPDEHGFMSFGVEVSISKPAAESARMVIAQVNEKMPRTLGDSFIHVSKVHAIVETAEPLPSVERSSFTEVERKIGENVAELIQDGATLQLGIGGIPDAILYALQNKKHLGIHTEMFSDGVMNLVEKGGITNEKKSIHKGKVVSSFAMGSQQLYEYLNNNPLFEFHPSHYTNDPFIIARNDNMVAVNSALEVDLTGQVCADSLGTYIYSGIGGQMDFIRGAARAKNGKPIIALPSTARKGEISRIVPLLKGGAGVVTTRGDVHYIVTEYGSAYLHGKNLKQRKELLMGVTHPQFKGELIDG